MSDPERYKCPRCNDEMDIKFIRSHETICAWSAILEARAVERLLRSLQ